MPSKKILILAIMLSLTSHMAMLSLTGFIDMQGKSPREEVVTVHLKDPPEEMDKKSETKEEPKANRQSIEKGADYYSTVQEEDTVDIGSVNNRYKSYLSKIKKKFENTWTYPQSAFEREEEGVTVLKFSINKNGALIATRILTSSGFKSLDQGALHVVQSAAPYDPFPREFDLSRLHIIARFHYKLAE